MARMEGSSPARRANTSLGPGIPDPPLDRAAPKGQSSPDMHDGNLHSATARTRRRIADVPHLTGPPANLFPGDAWRSSDHDLSGHSWMDRAVVLVGARDIERLGEPFVGVEHPRLEFLLRTHDVMGDVVDVRPRNGRPDWNGGRGRREAEVVDH